MAEPTLKDLRKKLVTARFRRKMGGGGDKLNVHEERSIRKEIARVLTRQNMDKQAKGLVNESE